MNRVFIKIKKLLVAILLFGLPYFLLAQIATDTYISEIGILDGVDPEIEIIDPDSPDTISFNNTLFIDWTASDSSFENYPFQLFYGLIDEDTSYTLLDSLDADRTQYQWQIPDIASGSYIVKIEATDHFGNTSLAFSNNIQVIGKNPNPVWYVSQNGNDLQNNGTLEMPYATIQHAINSCDKGDTIYVLAGTYTENLNINSKNIFLSSIDGYEQTIIEDLSGESCITISDSTYVTGFTITGSNDSIGIYITDGAPIINKNRILDNNIGIQCSGESTPLIRNNIISGNDVSIMCGNQSNIHILNNTIYYGNIAIEITSPSSIPTIINNIISNHAQNGIYCHNANDYDIRFNDIWNNNVNFQGLDDLTDTLGNISTDPQYIYADTMNFQLSSTSLAIDAGDTNSVYINEPEPNGDRINLGFFGNTGIASVADLAFIVPIDTIIEDSSYYQHFGIPPDSNVDFNYSINSLPAWLAMNEAETAIHGTPKNSDVGSAQINISVSDNYGRSDILDYFLDVVNSPPLINTNPDTFALEDSSYVYDVNCVDDGSGDIEYSFTTKPDWLGIDTQQGIITGVPENDDVGIDTIGIRVIDGNGGYDNQSFVLHVLDVNDAPILSRLPDTTTLEDTPISLQFSDLSKYVSDIDDETNTIIWDFLNSDHTSSDVYDDSVNINIAANWYGNDSINVIVSDSLLSDTNYFVLEVLPENDAPQWHMFSDTLIQTTDSLALYLPEYISDVDDSLTNITFSYDTAFSPSHFNLSLELDSYHYLYINPNTMTMIDSGLIYIYAHDTSHSTAADSFYLSIEKINYQPVFAQLPDINGLEDSTTFVLLDSLRNYVSDPDDSVHTLGWDVLNSDNITAFVRNDSMFFQPLLNWFGSDTLDILVFDESDTTNGKLRISIANVPDRPELIIADEYFFREDDSLKIFLDTLVNDVDTPSELMNWQVSFSMITAKNASSVTSSRAGIKNSGLHYFLDDTKRILTFTGDLNYFHDSIAVYYSVSDTNFLNSIDSNYITISSVNDPPEIESPVIFDSLFYEDDSYILESGELYNFVMDIETADSLLSWNIDSGIRISVDSVVNNETFHFSSDSNWFGLDTLKLSVSDSTDTTFSSFIVGVMPVNDPPQIIGIPDTSFYEDQNLILSLPDFVSDIDDDFDSLYWNIKSSDTTALSAIWNPDSRTVTFIPDTNYYGDSISVFFYVRDTAYTFDHDTCRISVIARNDRPEITAILDTSFYEDSVLVVSISDYLQNVEDVDNADSSLTISIKKDSGNVDVQFSEQLDCYSFTAGQDEDGIGYFTFTVADSQQLSDSVSFIIDIIPVNDPPIITEIPDTIAPQDTIFTLLVNQFAGDPDDDLDELIWSFTADTSQVIFPPDSSDSDTLRISPPIGYTGYDTIYTVLTDTSGSTALDTFRIKFIDSTPPFFTIGIFQNPVAMRYLDIYFFPNEPLDTVFYVTIDEKNKEIDSIKSITPIPYYCHHRLNSSDNYTVIISASDTMENSGETNYEFSATEVAANLGGYVFSPDSVVSLLISPQSFDKDRFVLCLPEAEFNSLKHQEQCRDMILTKPVSKKQNLTNLSYKFSSPASKLNNNAKLEFIYVDSNLPMEVNRPGIFQYISGKWQYLKTFRDENQKSLWVYTDRLSNYRVQYNAPEEPVCIPQRINLAQNYPNPFNPTTKINFSLPEFTGNGFIGKSQLIVYDILGREVIKLVDDHLMPGNYSILWNGNTINGKSVASGIYIYCLKYGKSLKSKKMVLIK